MKFTSYSSSYNQVHELIGKLGGQSITFLSKPGIPNWEQISPASVLLAESIEASTGARILLLGCGHGALATYLAKKFSSSQIWLTDINFIAIQMSTLTLQANYLQNAHLFTELDLGPISLGSFDVVVIEIPKGRKLVQRWLIQASYSLRQGGTLFIAGATNQGIQPAIKDSQAIFSSAAILGYKKSHRVARLVKSAEPLPLPAWMQEPGIAIGSWIEFHVEALGEDLHLRSLPGVFSSDELDEGTRLLLAQLVIPPGGRILDLGCGFGLIGLIAARSGASHVDLVDANLFAVASAQENLRLLHITNARVLPSDALSAVRDRQYDLIVTNPPFHVGRDVNYLVTQAFIQQSWQALAPGGRLLLVANKFLRYDQVMQATFTQVERLAETGRYHVFSAIK